ncbi:MAG: twin-arginine translocase TatA/TatE family subunit [Methylocystis sp.]|nr:twin-arginine translocase TatA/TatE family subunit [Methylocystis sp.]MBI3274570.1 twin-arginine translocase TatA/TatE family subunit [Methylocystis sp.]
MGGLSIWHWIIVGGVVFILFGGRFKISDVMTDVAKGIKAFKKGMAEEEPSAPSSVETVNSLEAAKSLETPLETPATVERRSAEPAAKTPGGDKV